MSLEIFKEVKDDINEYQAFGFKDKSAYTNLCGSVSDVFTFEENLSTNEWGYYNKAVVEFLIDKLYIKNVERTVIDVPEFVAHKSVINDLKSWFWHLYHLITSNFGEEYVEESLIVKLYFLMRDDLKIQVIESIGQMRIEEKSAKQKYNVSVIVTARNYGKFLKECLDSCLNQSVRPLEIIYSDDGSTDNSVRIAKKIDGIQVISERHSGVCEARNRAVKASKGNILIHVDGDDILPHIFIEKHLDALKANPNAPFVYGPAQGFGILNYFWKVPKWDEYFLWDQNFCNTSCAIRREYFDAVDGWKDNVSGTYWDWDLFLRISRYGIPAPSEAALLYRQHNQSWSIVKGERGCGFKNQQNKMRGIRQQRARVAVCCVYSGRLPNSFLSKWFKSLTNNLRTSNITEPVDLLIIDNSNNRSKGQVLKNEAYKNKVNFGTIRIIKIDRKIEKGSRAERQNEVAILLAEMYTICLQETFSDIILFIEDDLTFKDNFGIKKLFNCLTTKMPGAVSGAYRNRHYKSENPWIAANIRNNNIEQIFTLPKEKEYLVDLAGTGCLMIWKGLCPSIFQSNIKVGNYSVPAHDWQFTSQIKREKLFLTDVLLDHWKNIRECV